MCLLFACVRMTRMRNACLFVPGVFESVFALQVKHCMRRFAYVIYDCWCLSDYDHFPDISVC